MHGFTFSCFQNCVNPVIVICKGKEMVLAINGLRYVSAGFGHELFTTFGWSIYIYIFGHSGGPFAAFMNKIYRCVSKNVNPWGIILSLAMSEKLPISIHVCVYFSLTLRFRFSYMKPLIIFTRSFILVTLSSIFYTV